MRNFLTPAILVVGIWPCHAVAASKPDPMCSALRSFVKSVSAREKRELEFHTSWGSNFNNSTAPAFTATQCIDHGYAPAKRACKFFMENGAIEFSGNNALLALMCLSPGTTFAPRVQLDKVNISFSYGSDERGSNVTVLYDNDEKLGGMVLKITADGY